MITRSSMLVIGTAAMLLAIIVAVAMFLAAVVCFFTYNYYGMVGAFVGFLLLCGLIHEMLQTIREAL